MERMTQKEIRRFVTLGIAEDISYSSFDDCNKLMKDHIIKVLNVSTGTYGMNGALMQIV